MLYGITHTLKDIATATGDCLEKSLEKETLRNIAICCSASARFMLCYKKIEAVEDDYGF